MLTVFLEDYDELSPSEEDRPRFIRILRNASKGLLEFTGNVVQFIHESTREFFLNGPGFSLIDPRLRLAPIGESSLDVMVGCINMTEDDYGTYAQANLLDHAVAAEEAGVSTVILVKRILSSPCADKWKFWTGTLLHTLFEYHLTSCVEFGLANGFENDINLPAENTQTPLLAAIKRLSEPPVKLISILLETGAQVDYKDSDGITAMYKTAQFGYTATCQLLVEHGADVGIGTTALHIASRLGYTALVDFLISNGAPPNVTTL